MTRCQNVVFACSLALSLPTFAGNIEIAQWIPWSFITREIEKLPQDIDVTENDISMSAGELTPKLYGVRIALKTKLLNTDFSQNGIQVLEEGMASIQIDKLVVDQFILREFNGNQIQVHLKAECSPIKVSVPFFQAKAKSLFVPEENLWRPELTNISITIPAEHWKLEPINCSGIGGIGEEIRAQITNALKNPGMFESMLLSLVGDKLRGSILSSWNDLVQSTGEQLSIVSMERPSEKGFLIRATMPVQSNRNVGLHKLNHMVLSSEHPQLVLSPEGFEAILEDQTLRLVPENYNLQEVDGFSKLMKSRFKQFMVWPDLRRFSSVTPFYISLLKDQSQLKLAFSDDGLLKTQFNGNGIIRTEIGSSPIDYMVFGVSVKTNMTINVQDGIMSLANGTSELNFAWSYGLIYQMIYRPDRRIAVDILKNTITGFFNNQKAEQELPLIRWQDREWKLNNWKKQNDIITMDWL